MTIMSCGATGHCCWCAPTTPPAPLVADPAEPAEPEPVGTTPADPDDESLALVLVLPAGIRVRVEATITDAAAVRWLHDLGVAAMVLAMHGEQATGRSAR